MFFSLPVKETQSSMTIELKQIVINDAQESLASASGSGLVPNDINDREPTSCFKQARLRRKA